MALLTRNEVRRRLQVFAKQWQKTTRETADAKLFWARFYECFGIRPESATIYERSVQKINGSTGYIDSFIPGKLIVEHKSRGKDLERAFQQASDYYMGLNEAERQLSWVRTSSVRFTRCKVALQVIVHISRPLAGDLLAPGLTLRDTVQPLLMHQPRHTITATWLSFIKIPKKAKSKAFGKKRTIGTN